MTDLIDTVLLLPFRFLRAPALKLNLPRTIFRPSPMFVFVLVFFSYFIFLSGVIYDVITETPSVGGMRDPITGVVKPQAILEGRINGQYIIEGLTAGFLFSVGGIGFILLDLAVSRNKESNLLMVLAGTTLILIAYNVCIVFIRKKVGNYLR
eukprot:CAMPEP_0117016480 /NCGR_PEP_ID=MMETSP0472-20121206/12990_1 /TAXON_ID=693140 ORGANISM="Tiarina fusus, Strain LIS" /NCGR_SAMPLE_ID=MMETSP0472 /ASSEMBLY_ACC=CAM_ASM_000603 /LENGTH=151 /DNA_ID=CAMNT_0004720551 /DNA_START=9 /DNA_END=461 /DNA_ORIENTATION=-